jgi:hypothetical protein
MKPDRFRDQYALDKIGISSATRDWIPEPQDPTIFENETEGHVPEGAHSSIITTYWCARPTTLRAPSAVLAGHNLP